MHSVYEFIQLMSTVNKREQFRLMIFTKLLMKDLNCTIDNYFKHLHITAL